MQAWQQCRSTKVFRPTSLPLTGPFKPLKCWSLSCVQLIATQWTVAHRAPLSMEFSKQEYWSGQPFPSPGHLPDPGIEPRPSALQADSLLSEPPGSSFKPLYVDNSNPGFQSPSSLIIEMAILFLLMELEIKSARGFPAGLG